MTSPCRPPQDLGAASKYKPPCIGLHKLRYLHVHEVKKQHREMVISSPVLIGLSILIFHGSWILSDPAHITLAFGRSEWLKQDSSVLSLELNPFVSQIFNIWRICSAFASSCSMNRIFILRRFFLSLSCLESNCNASLRFFSSKLFIKLCKLYSFM